MQRGAHIMKNIKAMTAAEHKAAMEHDAAIIDAAFAQYSDTFDAAVKPINEVLDRIEKRMGIS